MNKIVRDYPVDSLPLDLREGLPEHGRVEIELRIKSTPSHIKLADLIGTGPNVHGTIDEMIEHIRTLRADRDETR